MMQQLKFERMCDKHGKQVILICFHKNCQNNQIVCPDCYEQRKQHIPSEIIGIDQLEQRINLICRLVNQKINQNLGNINKTNNKIEKVLKILLEKKHETINYLYQQQKMVQNSYCTSHQKNRIFMICNHKECTYKKFLCCYCLTNHSGHLESIIDQKKFEIDLKNIIQFLEYTMNKLQDVKMNLKRKIDIFKEEMMKTYYITPQIFNTWDKQQINGNITNIIKFIDEVDIQNKQFNTILKKHQIKLNEFQKYLLVDLIFIRENEKKQSISLTKRAGKEFSNYNYNSTLEHVDQALQLHGWNFQALYLKGQTLSMQKKYKESLEYFDKCLLIDDQNLNILQAKGETLMAMNLQTDAIEQFDQVLLIDDKYLPSLLGKGDALIQLQQFSQAIKWYDKAILIDANYLSTLCRKGDALRMMNKNREAIKYYDEVILIDENSLPALQGKGESLKAMNNLKDAIKWYDKALRIYDKSLTSLYGKGDILRMMGQYQHAIECFDKALLIDDKYLPVLYCKGEALEWINQHRDAIFFYDKALLINDKCMYALCGKGDALGVLGQHINALKCFDKAISINDKYLYAFYGKGNILMMMNLYQEAIQQYEKALSINNSNILKSIHTYKNDEVVQ